MPAQLLTVEIHDVSPATQADVETIYEALEEIDIHQPSLLVVPDYLDGDGRSWDLRNYPDSVEWLQKAQEQGCEIIQHGLTHRASGPPPPGLVNAVMHHWFSRGCGEFAHLSKTEAKRRLEIGRGILDDCGLASYGFIAPAWQQSSAAISVLRKLGYRFTAFFNHVLPLNGSQRIFRSPALTFDAPCMLIDYPKRLLMRCFEIIWSKASLLRIAIHPADLHGSRPLGHIISRIQKLRAKRRLVSYQGFFA
ncbi:MAG: polysaccharide deacetylase family protein [Deltaproteobacteria bacterium]|nr:polysaccharide deacetylase family protein [Deltaproteobacteria bacterium]